MAAAQWFLALLLTTNEVFIPLTAPSGNKIYLNPIDIVSVRTPQVSGVFDKKVNCVIFTLDGQFIGVMETCDRVREMVQSNE